MWKMEWSPGSRQCRSWRRVRRGKYTEVEIDDKGEDEEDADKEEDIKDFFLQLRLMIKIIKQLLKDFEKRVESGFTFDIYSFGRY